MNEIEREVFRSSTPDRAALLDFGFTPDGDSLRFSAGIVDGDFYVDVAVGPDGSVSSRVIDSATGDDYSAIFSEAYVGAYVGRVREEYRAFLAKISEACFVRAPFTSPQANRLAAHIASAYGEHEDRPFAKYPDCASFRSGSANKWYALLMPVKKGVLAGEKDAEKAVEVVNLKAEPEKIPELTAIPGIYPAYHMNKKYWISVILDGTVEDSLLFELVAVSRSFAAGRASLANESYIVPSSPLDYDVDAHFEREGDILWHQPKSVAVGDIVYLYYGSPVSAVRWKCEVLAVSQSGERYNDPRPQMLLRPVLRYDDSYCTFAKLNELGIRAVRGTRRATEAFVRYMEEYEA